jgi:hypothetical protein
MRLTRSKKLGGKPGRRGRPAGKRRGRRTKAVATVLGLDTVAQIVEQAVQRQVNQVLDRAIAVLNEAKI